MADERSARAPELAAPPLVSPTVEEWRALTPAARERFLVRVLDALSDPRVAMSEGRQHEKAKTAALDRLGLYFTSIGRVVYLAEEMAVLYPGEPPFTPICSPSSTCPSPRTTRG